MVFSDIDIHEAVTSGKIGISPYDPNVSLQPASYDLHLGGSFSEIPHNPDDIFVDDLMDCEGGHSKIHAPSITVYSRQFMLATTQEVVEIPDDVVAFVEGRSSVGRKGLFIHNAGLIDPGFKGQITLELFNASDRPLRINEGTRICQIVFMKLSRPAKRPYNGKYQNQRDVTVSRMHLDR